MIARLALSCLAALLLGSGEVKEVTPAAKRTPKGFMGMEPVQFIQHYLGIVNPIRDPFETTEQYNARLQAAKTKPFLDKLTPSSTFAFRPSIKLLRNYDADNSNAKLRVPYDNRVGEIPDILGSSQRTFRLAEDVTTADTYVAPNVFGVDFTIQREIANHICLATQDLDDPTDTAEATQEDLNTDGLNIRFKISPDKARQVFTRCEVLFIGHLAQDKDQKSLVESRYLHIPVTDAPYEARYNNTVILMQVTAIKVYDPETGEVLYTRLLNK